MNPHAAYEVTKRVRRVKVPLSKRTPEEWVERIKELPAALQPAISRVIWWDYFGNRISKDAWPHLDEMREEPMGEVGEKVQIAALVKLGYKRSIASNRVGYVPQSVENKKYR